MVHVALDAGDALGVVWVDDGPEEAILEPFLRRIAEHGLDRWADVERGTERVVRPIHVHGQGELLDQAPVALLGLALRLEGGGQLGRPLLDAALEGLNVLPQLRGHAVERPGQDTDLILGLDRGRGRQVALLDAGGHTGEREDRTGHLARDEVDGQGQEHGRHQADEGDRERQLVGWCEGLRLAHLDDEGRLVICQPAVHADDRDTLIVGVKALAIHLCEGLVDALRADAPRMVGGQRRIDELMFPTYQVCRAGRAEAVSGEDDPIDAGQAQVAG